LEGDYITGFWPSYLNHSFQVQIEPILSDAYGVNNVIPQGSAISPILFDMINDVFSNVGRGIGASLWSYLEEGKECHVIKYIQQAIVDVERWLIDWGFKLSVAKSSCMFFSKKNVADNIQLLLYGQSIGRVSEYKYLGLWFNERYTWKHHVITVETK
jgi:hypothetical protein